ncbi:hypothetical protein QBC39DRAFT_335071 [Podospora conica]|nr:hypothetical protein QBC39DRAFT_335071 [Schizothecium conicum]
MRPARGGVARTKNGTDGNIGVAIDAIGSAAAKHHFMGVTGPRRGMKVAAELAEQIGEEGKFQFRSAGGSCSARRRWRRMGAIMGATIESNIGEGAVPKEGKAGLQQGVSITDACIGWDDTIPVLELLANAVKKGGADGFGVM